MAGFEHFCWSNLVKNRFASAELSRKTWATILMRVSGKTHISPHFTSLCENWDVCFYCREKQDPWEGKIAVVSVGLHQLKV